jgi:hypothetical protein
VCRAVCEGRRELIGRAAASAQHADEKELAAGYEAEAGLREALIGIGAWQGTGLRRRRHYQ